MGFVDSGSHLGVKPPKEMRTVRREGDVITEDYERLNPDGTVTKTITVTDANTGEQKVSVYKMDKSGIVRKVEEGDEKTWAEAVATKQNILQQLKDKLNADKERLEELKPQSEKLNSQSVAYQTGNPYYRHGDTYSKKAEEEELNKHELSYNLRNINKPIELTPKQQAMVQEHKENILNYGTQKLIKQLNKKLSDDRFNEAYTLTDEQKDQVIEYGIRKFHKLLEKNLDEEKLIRDVMSFSPDFGKVDLSGRGTRQIPGEQSVSFSLNPYKNNSPEDIEKPVSFSMRPENLTKPLAEPDKTNKNLIRSIWDKIMSSVKPTEKDNEDDYTNDDVSDTINKNDGTDGQEKPIQDLDKKKEEEDFSKLKDKFKQLLNKEEIYKKSGLPANHKDDIADYALEQVRSILEDTRDPKDLEIDNIFRKKKIDLRDYFDEDEVFDYGKRSLKKLVRRSLKAFNLDNETVLDENLEDPELNRRRDLFFQYLDDVVEGRIKECATIPKILKQYKVKEEPEEESKWDYLSLLSNLFGKEKKHKTQDNKENEKEKPENIKELGTSYSWPDSDKEAKKDTEKELPEQNRNTSNDRPRFYQLDPQNDNKKEQIQNESKAKFFDLKGLLQQIQAAAVKQFSEPKTTENVNSQADRNNSQERELTKAEIDAALSKVRQTNTETSNSRRIFGPNKPPYLKERISGLDSIPRPKITVVSPSERNVNCNDQISFQLKPHGQENPLKQEDKPRSFENQRIEIGKPVSNEQDFEPWWFESPDSFVKKTFEKPLIKTGFIDAPMISSSFSTGGNKGSLGGSFSPKSIL